MQGAHFLATLCESLVVGPHWPGKGNKAGPVCVRPFDAPYFFFVPDGGELMGLAAGMAAP